MEKLFRLFVKRALGVKPIQGSAQNNLYDLGYHHSDKVLIGNIKAGSYSPQNYFGEGIYTANKKGLYPAKNVYKVSVPKNVKTLDLTIGNKATQFAQKVAKETGLPYEPSGMGLYEDLRLMASKVKNGDEIVRGVVDKFTKGYEVVKSPLVYEGQYETVLRKPNAAQLPTIEVKTGVPQKLQGTQTALEAVPASKLSPKAPLRGAVNPPSPSSIGSPSQPSIPLSEVTGQRMVSEAIPKKSHAINMPQAKIKLASTNLLQTESQPSIPFSEEIAYYERNILEQARIKSNTE